MRGASWAKQLLHLSVISGRTENDIVFIINENSMQQIVKSDVAVDFVLHPDLRQHVIVAVHGKSRQQPDIRVEYGQLVQIVVDLFHIQIQLPHENIERIAIRLGYLVMHHVLRIPVVGDQEQHNRQHDGEEADDKLRSDRSSHPASPRYTRPCYCQSNNGRGNPQQKRHLTPR